MRKFVLCMVMVLTFASPAAACIGARQAAMGWCGVAISDDATTSYWNPAALVWARDGFMYGSIWGSTDLAAKYGSFGFHYVADWDKWYWRISYGHQLDTDTAIGFNVGWFNYTYGHHHPSLDIAYLHKHNNFTFGVLAQNLGNIRPEIACNTDHVTISVGLYDLFDICKHYNDDGISLRDLHAGIELRPVSFLALRGGYISNYDNLTYGVAIKTSFLTLDYVRIEEVNCFSITCIF